MSNKNDQTYIHNKKENKEVMENEVLIADEVAQMLRIDRQRVYEITRRNLLPHVKIADRQYRYVKSEIEAWMLNGGNTKECTNEDK